MLNSTRVSLFDYLGKPAGASLGREVYKAAKREGVKTTSRDIQTRSYSGKVMLYPKGWLENYFKERGQVLTNSHVTDTVSSANFGGLDHMSGVCITDLGNFINITVDGTTGNSLTSIHSTAIACEDSSEQISKTRLKKYETRLIYRPITL